MQRLINLLRHRARDDRGAVAVVVALLMVPLLGFAAVAVDIAAVYAERQQLQTGADAAALAIAADCARGACGSPSSTAQNLSTDNINSHHSSTATVAFPKANKVTVSNSGVRSHVFAPILGVNSTELSARATVEWGSPNGGTALLPLAFSWCEWKGQTGGGQPSGTVNRLIHLSKSSETIGCAGPSGNNVPGGFGWITTTTGSCNATSVIHGVLQSDPGNSMPGTCSTSNLEKLRNTRVLLPVFDKMAGSGSGATYTVYGYAAFVLTGYHFGGQNTWNSPCHGSERCIQGYFAKFVDSSEAFSVSASAPQLGGAVLSMTQ